MCWVALTTPGWLFDGKQLDLLQFDTQDLVMDI